MVQHALVLADLDLGVFILVLKQIYYRKTVIVWRT